MNDPSNRTPALDLVCEMILEAMAENGIDGIPLSPDTRILQDTPLDSMGLAVVVLKLEERTGLDPFNDGFIMFQTVSELAKLYEH